VEVEVEVVGIKNSITITTVIIILKVPKVVI